MLQFGFSRKASAFFSEEVIPELNGEDDLGVREDQILSIKHLQNPIDKCEHGSNRGLGNSSVAGSMERGLPRGMRLGRWHGKGTLVPVCIVGDRPGAGQLEGVNTWAGMKDTHEKEINKNTCGGGKPMVTGDGCEVEELCPSEDISSCKLTV